MILMMSNTEKHCANQVLECFTYSKEKPKFSLTLASAVKILQYSRIMF